MPASEFRAAALGDTLEPGAAATEPREAPVLRAVPVARPRVLVLGEALVDFVPTHRGPLRDTRAFELHSGGAPGNVAIGCARLGAEVAFVAVVGDDEFGQFLRQGFEREGLDVRGLRHTAEQQTGLCFITLDPNGERRFSHRGGSPEALLNPEDVDAAVCAASHAVQFSAGSLRRAEGAAAILKAIEHAGGMVCCDPGTTPRHWADPLVLAERLSVVLGRCHVVKCASDEAEGLTGVSDPREAARRLVAQGAQLGVVTRGPQGAVWARAHDEGEVPSPPVTVVDTTGAGDAFMAALVVGLASEGVLPARLPVERLEVHLRFACEIGAQAVTALGAVAGVPRRAPVSSRGESQA